jgi:hypothetical protein
MDRVAQPLRASAASRSEQHAGALAHDAYLISVGLIGVLAVWVRPLGSSLGLDETGTFWVIQGDLGQVVDRALDFQGQFPLYHTSCCGGGRRLPEAAS